MRRCDMSKVSDSRSYGGTQTPSDNRLILATFKETLQPKISNVNCNANIHFHTIRNIIRTHYLQSLNQLEAPHKIHNKNGLPQSYLSTT